MSEERFDAIERKLDTVAAELRQEIGDRRSELREEFDQRLTPPEAEARRRRQP